MLDDPDFAQFARANKRHLQRIARATGGEQQYADVVNESWLMGMELAAKLGKPVDFTDAQFQDTLLRHLFQKLVRYTELNVRQAVRLDHARPGAEDEGDVHPLMNKLVSDDGRDPLSTLIERETTALQEAALKPNDTSLAAAYVRLLDHFNNRMGDVAGHLLISIFYAYRCCARARVWATHQTPVPWQADSAAALPGPWRRFRLQHVPVQLAFDFSEQRSVEV